MYGLSTLWSTGGRKPIIYMAPYLNSYNDVPILTNGFQEALKNGMSSTSSNRSIKVLGFKEKISDVDVNLIINRPRERTPSSSRDASPVSIRSVEELEDYTLSRKKERANTLKIAVKTKVIQSVSADLKRPTDLDTVPSNVLSDNKRKKFEIPEIPEIPEKWSGKRPISRPDTFNTDTDEDSFNTDPNYNKRNKNESPELSSKRPISELDSSISTDTPIKRINSNPAGGAVIDSVPKYSLKIKNSDIPTSVIDLDQEKLSGLEKIKVARAPQQITSSIERSPQNYTEGYRNNLIYVLQNNLKIIKSVHEKYDILLSNNNLNTQQITDDNKFFIAIDLLLIKRILIDLNTPYELLIELLEKVDANTTIEQSINIKNMFNIIFNEYNTVNNIGLYGIEYYFNIPDEMEMDVQLDTTVQIGGVSKRYSI